MKSVMKAKITYIILSIFLLSAVSIQEACAQSWLQDIGQGVKKRAKDRAKERVEEKIYQKVDNAVDKAVDKAFESTEEAVDKAVDKAVTSAEKKVRTAADSLTAAAEELAAAAEDLSVSVADVQETQPLDNTAFRALMAEFSSRPSGGEAFYPTRKGIEMTYANKNAKGKADSHSKSVITDILWKDERNFSVTTESYILDADRKPVTTEPMTAGVTVENGVVKYDPGSMAGQLMAGMEVSGDDFYMPDNIRVGDVLPDYTVIVNISGMKTSSVNKDVKVTGRETIAVSGYDIDCYIVESIVSVTALGLKSEMTQKVWYGRGIGQVKQESYNKKGKLMSIYELVELSGY